MIICGVDPGLSGAIAWYWPGTPSQIRADDLPRVGKEIDGAQLAAWLLEMRPDRVFLEHASSRPMGGSKDGTQRGQGAASAFTTGHNYGLIKGVLAALGIPYALVASSKWKRDFGLSKDKSQSRQLAMRKWPEGRSLRGVRGGIKEGRAEAALIALWGATQ